jgi:hypothetical protein
VLEENDQFNQEWMNAAKNSKFDQARKMILNHGNALTGMRPSHEDDEAHYPGEGRNKNIGGRREAGRDIFFKIQRKLIDFLGDLVASQSNRRPLALLAPAGSERRQEPRRAEGGDMRKPEASGANNSGVYRNKNAANVMPKQG